uniref:MULE transposase domain-containing protein n=1 Tax=Plectus sambesii TaxID=2011161 RepID=A0A914XJ59_9BILA
MDFVPCAPVYAVSSHRQWPIIQYQSKRWDGAVLEFRYKSAGPKDSNILYYQCIACKKLADMSRVGGEKCGVAHIKLVNGVIVTDPDNTNTPHNCGAGTNSTKASEVLAKRYMYKEWTKVWESQKRPRAAFEDAIDGVEERFKSEYGQEVVNNIKTKLHTGYGFASKRRALTENWSFHVVKDNTLENIHSSLRITKDGEEFLQKYDLTPDREMLIFFAVSDLELLLEAEFVLCDGNHKYNPPDFHKPGQLYTLHTIVKGECHPFIKAINAKRDGLGLKVHCTEKDEHGVLTHQANSIKKWFKRVRYLCFLPEHLRHCFARDLLQAVPIYPSAIINAQLHEFCLYFETYWLGCPLIRNVWGQFGNCGPRTTNYVEGWHNGLHSHMNGRHPSLAEIIGLFQSSQDSRKFRLRALRTDPLALPKPQKAEVIRHNTLLHEEMTAFHHYFMSTPMTTFQDILNYIDRIIAIGVLLQQL